MKEVIDNKKFADIVILIICLIFITLALFAYFVMKRLSLENLIITILFFGVGAIAEIIAIKSKQKGWVMQWQNLTKKQLFIMTICGFIFGFSLLWIALSNNNIHILLRVVLIFGFLFFSIGYMWILIKRRRKGSGAADKAAV